jgi:1-acyl-sn-glycerol-3-phosphate acyltransferase
MHDAERDWARRATRSADLTIETHGLHRVDPCEQYVIAPLHEGFADVLALSLLPLDIKYSATEELFEWRLLGRYLTASGQGAVSLDNRASAYRSMFRTAESAFGQGESYLVFPQGSILGIEVAFHQGAFRLAARTGRPLLPVVLTGSTNVWEHPFSPNLNFGRTIRMEILEPVDTADAVHRARDIENDMKQRALEATPGPRRFEPDRDGWWDGYRYEIDPSFPDLAERLAEHRSEEATYDTRPTTHDQKPPTRSRS